jgi:RimJ/RimL family protein N-acetyltransferase
MPSASDVALVDGDLVVRAWHDRDAGAVGVTPRSPEISRYFGSPVGGFATEPDRDAPAFAIVENGEPVGRIWFAPHLRPFEVGYFLRPDAWGRGLATRSLALVCDWMAEQGETTIVLHTHPDNARSQRVAERAGFCRDGVTDPYAHFKDGTTAAVRFVRSPAARGRGV